MVPWVETIDIHGLHLSKILWEHGKGGSHHSPLLRADLALDWYFSFYSENRGIVLGLRSGGQARQIFLTYQSDVANLRRKLSLGYAVSTASIFPGAMSSHIEDQATVLLAEF